MVKYITLLFALIFSTSSMAYNPKDIYEALDVPEFHFNPGIAGHSRIEKSVGGLTCIKTRLMMNSEATYSCELLQDEFILEDEIPGYPVE